MPLLQNHLIRQAGLFHLGGGALECLRGLVAISVTFWAGMVIRLPSALTILSPPDETTRLRMSYWVVPSTVNCVTVGYADVEIRQRYNN